MTPEIQREPIAQRSRQKLYFNHKDMDYYLSWIMGRQLYDGSEARECLAVASRIVDGDTVTWQWEWLSLLCFAPHNGKNLHTPSEQIR